MRIRYIRTGFDGQTLELYQDPMTSATDFGREAAGAVARLLYASGYSEYVETVEGDRIMQRFGRHPRDRGQ